MYKRFSWLLWFFLSLIPIFGVIYSLYVFYKMSRDRNTIAAANGESTVFNFIIALLLSFFTLGISSIVWIFLFYNQASKLNRRINAGISPDNCIVMVLLCLIPIFNFYWAASVQNKIIEASERQYTEEQ